MILNQGCRDTLVFLTVEIFTVVCISSWLCVSDLSIILIRLQFVCFHLLLHFNSFEEPIEGHNGDTLEQSQYTQKERHHGVQSRKMCSVSIMHSLLLSEFWGLSIGTFLQKLTLTELCFYSHFAILSFDLFFFSFFQNENLQTSIAG